MNDTLLHLSPKELADICKRNTAKAKLLREQLAQAEHIQESSEFILGISLRTEEQKAEYLDKLLQG